MNLSGASYYSIEVYNLIDINNNVLIRSLGCWIKSNMLFKFQCFNEESCALMFFSLDGLVKLLLEDLQTLNKKASFIDLIDYLVDQYSVPREYGWYLEMCYDKRTTIVHPKNYISTAWTPPLEAEDLFETGGVIKNLAWIYVTGRRFMESYLH